MEPSGQPSSHPGHGRSPPPRGEGFFKPPASGSSSSTLPPGSHDTSAPPSDSGYYELQSGEWSDNYSPGTSHDVEEVHFQPHADCFDIELFNPSRSSLALPNLDYVVGDSRWVTVRAETGRDDMVHMKRAGTCYVLEKGWNIIVEVEALAEGQTARFQMVDENAFYMWNDDYRRPNGPVGFSKAVRPPGPSWGEEDYYLGKGTHFEEPVTRAMNEIWAASSTRSKMYACTILPSHLERRALFFSTEYSSFLPDEARPVALRYVGSPLTVPGSMVKDKQKVARVTSGWNEFAEIHRIRVGDVFVFRVHQGPSTWELIACRSAMIVV